MTVHTTRSTHLKWHSRSQVQWHIKEACRKANPVILEPIMKVVVTVPEEYMGDVIGDLSSRRGEIQGMEDRNGVKQINAFVPLPEMFGYSNDPRSKVTGSWSVCNGTQPLHSGSQVNCRWNHQQES